MTFDPNVSIIKLFMVPGNQNNFNLRTAKPAELRVFKVFFPMIKRSIQFKGGSQSKNNIPQKEEGIGFFFGHLIKNAF